MQNRIAVFGYGSLANKKSLETTLQRSPGELLPVLVRHWKRDWSIVFSDRDGLIRYEPEENHHTYQYIRALNIRLDKTQSTQPINGVLFEVSQSELAALDAREKHYVKVDITTDIITPHSFQSVYTYVGMPQYIDHGDIAAKTPQSYIEVVEEGFRALGDVEFQKFRQTTAALNA